MMLYKYDKNELVRSYRRIFIMLLSKRASVTKIAGLFSYASIVISTLNF